MALAPINVNADQWNAFVSEQAGHLLQTATWGQFKSEFGWRSEIVAIGTQGVIRGGALVLYRSLPLGMGTIAYVPRGPVTDWADPAVTGPLLTTIDEAARRHGAILLKLEPDQRDTESMRTRLISWEFQESEQTVQPPRTILIDITGPTGDIESSDDKTLMRMSGSTRRKIRIPYRKGVKLRRGTHADLTAFNRMMQATGSRQEFGVHSAAYYERAFELFAPEHASLFMASYQGQDLAGLMAFAYGDTASYFFGASRDLHRNLMATYALQWEAIQWAREKGCAVYDMWGVPDVDEADLEEHFRDRRDGLWGPYGFKRGFGGDIVRMVGAWDKPYRPLRYEAYKLALRFRTQ